jgi:hypothetical protein
MKITYFHRIDTCKYGLFLLAYDENDNVIFKITYDEGSSECYLEKSYMSSLAHFEKIECDI